MGTVAFDGSGMNNHGILYGPTWTPSGKISSGLYFDGINDYVDCGANSSLDISESSISVESWIKIDEIPAAQHVIISKWIAFVQSIGY